MLYKLTWQTKDLDGWCTPQFVVGDIGPIHKCYNALIRAYRLPWSSPSNLCDDAVPLRAVVTAIQAETDNGRGSIVYEWGWPGKEEVAK